MKITVVSGEDQIKARARFAKIIEAIRARNWEVVSVNPTLKLADQLRSNSLFGSTILFTIEDVNKISPVDLEWLSKNCLGLEGNLLCYSKGNIGKLAQKNFPQETKFENFDLPFELFKLLETIYPGNKRQVLQTLEIIIKTQPIELVFSMLAKHVKDLYWVLIDEKNTGFPSWRIGKLRSQAIKFGKDKLEELIQELAEIDIKVKTSQADLKQSLDFVFASKLQ